MMRGLLLLANGFEDVEALATFDVLKRSGLDIRLASVEDTLELHTQSGIKMFAMQTLKETNLDMFDFLIIPGGKAVFQRLDHLESVTTTIKYFSEENKLIAAICAAPHLLGKLGILQDKNYVCYPNCNDRILGGNLLKDKHVVLDGNIITGRAMALSIEFALAIIEKLQGNTQRKEIEKSILGIYL